jgi:hypothetical protein
MSGTVPTVAIIDGVKIDFYSMSIRRRIFTPATRSSSRKWDIATLEVIRGSLPPPQLQTVKAWAIPRREALLAAWDACAAGRNPGRID